MSAAFPVDDQNDFSCIVVDVRYDVFDQCPDQSLLVAHGCRRSGPGGLKVLRQPFKARDIYLRCRCVIRIKTLFETANPAQGFFPPFLQF